MKGFRGLVLVAALAGLAGLGCEVWAQTGDLNSVLKQMDESSPKFKSAQADVKREIYEAAVRDTTTQTGSTYLLRSGSSLQMGMKFLPPDVKVVEIKDGVLRMFEPAANHLTQVSMKNNQSLFETYLALGFGGSGSDLAKQWTLKYKGSSQMNDGKKTGAVAAMASGP